MLEEKSNFIKNQESLVSSGKIRINLTPRRTSSSIQKYLKQLHVGEARSEPVEVNNSLGISSPLDILAKRQANLEENILKKIEDTLKKKSFGRRRKIKSAKTSRT